MTTDIQPTIRTVTAFVNLHAPDFEDATVQSNDSSIAGKVAHCVTLLRAMETELCSFGYTVQTVRIATNPFGEWLVCETGNSDDDAPPKATTDQQLHRLERLDQLLQQHQIDFCSVGPAKNRREARYCPHIVATSHRFSCSATVDPGDVDAATCAAETILTISRLDDTGDHVRGGLGNFRFCAAASCKPFIPFFPAAKSSSSSSFHATNHGNTDRIISFAIGLENGRLAGQLLNDCKSIRNVKEQFIREMANVLRPINDIAKQVADKHSATYLGIDTSLNPSLDEDGSVAAAIEKLEEVTVFGGPGTLGAAAEITRALQSLPEDIPLTGYCGLMLPVCEDTRLAQLASATKHSNDRVLRITDILSISSVCGVGIDTVPVPGDCSKEELASLILDVAGIAGRWDKSLSCRVFPVPGKTAGDMTDFDSPYMINSSVFALR
jgi:uncharacterized protein (UPF0210 family)